MGATTFAAAYRTRSRSCGSGCGSPTALCTTSRTNLSRGCCRGFAVVVTVFVLAGVADADCDAAAMGRAAIRSSAEKNNLKTSNLGPQCEPGYSLVNIQSWLYKGNSRGALVLRRNGNE